MALAFPNNPTVGDEYSIGGSTYSWDGYSWTAKESPAITVEDNSIAYAIALG